MPTIGAAESFLQTNDLEAVTEDLRETQVELQNAQIESENTRRRNLTPITETAEETQPLPILNFTSQSVQIKEEPHMLIELPDDDDDDILEIMTQCSMLQEAIVISSEDEDEVNALPKILSVMKISPSAKRKEKPHMLIELPDDDDDDILEIMTQCSMLQEAIVISSEDEDEVNALPKIFSVMKISPSAKRKGSIMLNMNELNQ